MASADDTRARLESQAARILGAARVEAAEILRRAKADADDVVAQANRYAESRMAKADADRDGAKRELSQARTHADAIVRNSTVRARAEADELLRDAQRRLATLVDETREAEARIAETRARLDAEIEALKRMSDTESALAAAVAKKVQHAEPWTVDLTKEPFEEMVEAAVRAAVRRAVHPVEVRAGRYIVPRPDWSATAGSSLD